MQTLVSHWNTVQTVDVYVDIVCPICRKYAYHVAALYSDSHTRGKFGIFLVITTHQLDFWFTFSFPSSMCQLVAIIIERVVRRSWMPFFTRTENCAVSFKKTVKMETKPKIQSIRWLQQSPKNVTYCCMKLTLSYHLCSMHIFTHLSGSMISYMDVQSTL